MRALIVQYKPIYLKIGSNLKKIDRIIKQNIHLKPDLVIFPEYALTGPLYGHYNLALKNNSKVFNCLRMMAKKYKIHLVPGCFIRKVDSERFNSSCLIDDKGKILGFYDKRLLWGVEKRFLSQGRQNRLFKTKFGKIAIQICADLNSALISAEYYNLEPHLIINPTFWSKEDINACFKKVPENLEYLTVETLSRARAIEAKAFFIFCNWAGKAEIKTKSGRIFPTRSIGNSMIVNPFGEIIGKSSSDKEEVILADLDISQCHWFKYQKILS